MPKHHRAYHAQMTHEMQNRDNTPVTKGELSIPQWHRWGRGLIEVSSIFISGLDFPFEKFSDFFIFFFINFCQFLQRFFFFFFFGIFKDFFLYFQRILLVVMETFTRKGCTWEHRRWITTLMKTWRTTLFFWFRK